MSMTLEPTLKYVVIQKVAKATMVLGSKQEKSHICSIQNKKHGGLTNISKNVRGAFMLMTLGPIFLYVVIQKVAKASNGIRVLTS